MTTYWNFNFTDHPSGEIPSIQFEDQFYASPNLVGLTMQQLADKYGHILNMPVGKYYIQEAGGDFVEPERELEPEEGIIFMPAQSKTDGYGIIDYLGLQTETVLKWWVENLELFQLDPGVYMDNKNHYHLRLLSGRPITRHFILQPNETVYEHIILKLYKELN